jgi:flagellar basal body rod protein FlgB
MNNLAQNTMSAVRAHARKAMVHAFNTANINTEAARPLKVSMESASTGGTRARVEQSESANGADLAQEAIGMMEAGLGYQANLAAFRASDKTLGVLIDTVA